MFSLSQYLQDAGSHFLPHFCSLTNIFSKQLITGQKLLGRNSALETNPKDVRDFVSFHALTSNFSLAWPTFYHRSSLRSAKTIKKHFSIPFILHWVSLYKPRLWSFNQPSKSNKIYFTLYWLRKYLLPIWLSKI